MKKLKLYLETSVWNFLFADDAPDKRNETDIFFAEVKAGYYDIYISDIVLAEIADAQSDKHQMLLSAINQCSPKVLSPNEESDIMVMAYLERGLLTAKRMVDLAHLAIASVNDIDMLVSWNMKHLVKSRTRMLANAINHLNGYHDIEICTPGEAIYDED